MPGSSASPTTSPWRSGSDTTTADGKRRSLGSSATGARVALPIFSSIIDSVWALQVAPKVALSGPSPEAKRHLIDLPIDLQSGDRVTGGGRSFVEHFRLADDGRFTETQYQLVSREEAYAARGREQGYGQWANGDQDYWGRGGGIERWSNNRSFFPFQGWQQPAPPRGYNYSQPQYRDQDDVRQRPVRRDPDYFWGGRVN